MRVATETEKGLETFMLFLLFTVRLFKADICNRYIQRNWISGLLLNLPPRDYPWLALLLCPCFIHLPSSFLGLPRGNEKKGTGWIYCNMLSTVDFSPGSAQPNTNHLLGELGEQPLIRVFSQLFPRYQGFTNNDNSFHSALSFGC